MAEAIIFAPAYRQRLMENNNVGAIQLSIPDLSARFEEVFKANYKALHAYACTIMREEDAAEEVVQNVFYKLWERKEQINSLESPVAYLYRSVYNDCLNHIKHLKVRAAHQSYTLHTSKESENHSNQTDVRELEKKIEKALKILPEQCRTIFQMSRFEELKYREIADRLNLSVKTVENQMGKALRILRTELAEYLPIILIFLNL